MGKRLCVASGPWQVIMATAALRQADRLHPAKGPSEDVLVLHAVDSPTSPLGRVMESIAQAVHPWAKIVWAYEEITRPGQGRRLDNHFYRSDLPDLLSQALARMGSEPPDTLFVCTLRSPAEKLVAEIYPKAAICLYEDGLQTYVPARRTGLPATKTWRHSASKAAAELWGGLTIEPFATRRIFRGWNSVSAAYCRRVECMYLYMVRDLPLPEPFRDTPVQCIENDILRDVISISQSRPDIWPAGGIEGNCQGAYLALGQCYAHYNWVSRERELAVYASVVEKLLDRGHCVVWKDHPRLTNPYFPDLQTLFPHSDRLQRFDLPATIPVELAATQMQLTGCVAGTSSSLFYLKHLYGIKTYSFASLFTESMPYDPTIMIRLVVGSVPDIQEI